MTADKPVDLFGNEITSPEPAPIADGKRRKTVARGYAAPPGTGPKGETCRSCVHYTVRQMGGTYRKCGKVRERWTGGPGTDILAKAPACAFWEPVTDAPTDGERPLYQCEFSPDRRYRYVLENRWSYSNQPGWKPRFAMFVGVNPSTANERALDRTLMKIEKFVRKWQWRGLYFDGFLMTNVFGFRATKPPDMRAQSDPIGPDNDKWLLACADRAEIIVPCWGALIKFPRELLPRERSVRDLLNASGKPLLCLGYNDDGTPRHPLFLPADTPLEEFR